MSNPCVPDSNCNYCGHLGNCSKKFCDYCGECNIEINSFPDCAFDLCNECLNELTTAMTKGLIKIDQRQPVIEQQYIEKVITVRKTITEAEREEIFIRDNRMCQICGSREKLQIDHIVPFSQGGTTAKENLQTLCKSCNCIKGTKT